MSWNYRICRERILFTLGKKRRAETIYSLREVFYGGEDGKDQTKIGWTDKAMELDGLESPEELIKVLEMMIADAKKKRPVIFIGRRRVR